MNDLLAGNFRNAVYTKTSDAVLREYDGESGIPLDNEPYFTRVI
jgi:hypothetical protein